MLGERRSVYVSSTYRDLAALRNRVIAAIRKLRAFHPVNMENYTASSRTALEKCLADVRSCDVYVGIIGWRAGFIPEGEQLPITQLEYQAARQAGLPCLFFLVGKEPPEPSDKEQAADLARVRAFREEVRRRHLPCDVEADHAIGEAVLAALFEHAWGEVGVQPRPPEVPPLLPYLCDRTDQRGELFLALGADAAAGGGRHRVPVCMLHGAPEQAPHQFLEWLSERLFRELAGLRDGTLQEYRVAWPTARVNDESFLVLFAKNLADAAQLEGSLTWQRAALIEALQQQPDYYLSIVLSIDHWNELVLQRLSLVARYFDDWPSQARIPRAVLFWLTYKALPRWNWLPGRGRAGEQNKLVREALEKLITNDRIRLVSELRDVLEDDAVQWACDPDVLRFASGGPLVPEVRKLFEGTQGQPMETAAAEFRRLLERRQHGNDKR